MQNLVTLSLLGASPHIGETHTPFGLLRLTTDRRGQAKYSRRANIADSAHFRETAKDAGAA